MTTTYKIALIPGDGIGPEVIDEAVRVLNRVAELDERIAFEFTKFPWGCEYYLKNDAGRRNGDTERL